MDIGLVDATVPAPQTVRVASLLDPSAPRLRADARETVVADKLEAQVVLGLTASRMKDLQDLDLLRRKEVLPETCVRAPRRRMAPAHPDVHWDRQCKYGKGATTASVGPAQTQDVEDTRGGGRRPRS